MLQRWPWSRPARRNSSRPDDSKIPRVITRHGHSDVPVAYCYGRTTICKASSATSNGPGALSMPYRRVWTPRKSMACQEALAWLDIFCCQVVQYGGTHSAALRSALLPFPASSLPRELVSGRHLPLPEAVGWPRPPYRTTWQTTCRLMPSPLKNGVRKRHYLPRFRKFEQTV